MVIESLRDISHHLDVLLLILTNRYFGRFEHQDVGGHQDRITIECEGDALVWILIAVIDIGLYGRLVRVRAIHQPFGCHTGQYPGQLGNLGNI